ncbi:hypothetical protein [Pedobacter sp. MC2016-24]|uniref:hypothetical protein n=1 Tax=Pedobacter sp. MC2016-24 TaxID=2780090 RepID=UPI001881E372|nr:hypothetical protein [Pedobacter sp. MC2016-24]MBE9603147.1 hypothetical protein [Pedobacter sp. MC2016-24]
MNLVFDIIIFRIFNQIKIMYSSRIILYFLLLTLLGCRNKERSESSIINPIASSLNKSDRISDDTKESFEEYPDGEYCASIDYYNPNTGTQSTYTLTVEVSGGALVIIHWPSGGWFDDSHFNPPTLESGGSCEFTSYDGKHYSIQIEEEGSCGNSSTAPTIGEDNEDEESLLENTEEVGEEDNAVVNYSSLMPIDLCQIVSIYHPQ